MRSPSSLSDTEASALANVLDITEGRGVNLVLELIGVDNPRQSAKSWPMTGMHIQVNRLAFKDRSIYI